MDNALIVSSTIKSTEFFTEMLNAAACNQIVVLKSCAEARRVLIERDFDLVVINAPLPDETGEALARQIATKGASQVILVVRAEYFEEVSVATEDDGVLTVARPISRTVFWSTLKLAKSVQNRLGRIRAENEDLRQKIENIRIVDRAKCILIAALGISEQDAHRAIEKQAMDRRAPRRQIAEEIIAKYDH